MGYLILQAHAHINVGQDSLAVQMKSAFLLTGSVIEKMTVGTIQMRMVVLIKRAKQMNSAATMDDAYPKHGIVIKLMIVKMDLMSMDVNEM